MWEIEKDVPIPVAVFRDKRASKYPHPKMAVGDSYFVQAKGVRDCNPYRAAQQHGRRYGKKFVARTVDGGVRIWRVA